jgi:hypothetical protein
MYTMEYFSAVKNKIVSSAEKWMETLMHVTRSAKFRKTNIACFLSNMEFRPKNNNMA